MVQSYPNSLKSAKLLAIATAIGLGAMAGQTSASADTMSLTLQSTAPATTSSDASFIGGSTTDGTNVGGNLVGNSGYGNGTGGNDQYQYVATDRPDQGQTFTTGANSGGYTLTDIWVQHVNYTGENSTTSNPNYNGTYWGLPSGANLTLRITNPNATNSNLTALDTFTYTATGTELNGATWTGNSATGDGEWLDFKLGTPVTLAAGTNYGFDLTSTNAGTNGYFELAGTDASGAYSGGSAYNGNAAGGSAGAPDSVYNALQGSRVFVASMTAVPEPTTLGMAGVGLASLLLIKRRRRLA